MDVTEAEHCRSSIASLRTELTAAAARPLPTPGGGDTIRRFRALADLGRNDLELARLAEAHYDALAIADDLGVQLPDAFYGVWAASGPEPLVATTIVGGYKLARTVPWCTGSGIVDRALVAACGKDPTGDKHGLLFDLRVAEGTVDNCKPWASPAFRRTNTASVRFDLSVACDRLVGRTDEYFNRAGFWHGAIGVSAVWMCGLMGLLDLYRRKWKRTDPHALAHSGSAQAWTDVNRPASTSSSVVHPRSGTARRTATRIRFDIDPISTSALTPGPVIVLCRHVNVVDASLPTLLYQHLGYRTRGVIMIELLADPGFDLIYSRTGSVFIPRDNGPEAIGMVRTIGRDVDATTAVVIFPEGRLFRPDRLKRAVSRLTLGNPERGARLSSLRHVLPPRPGGVLDTGHLDVEQSDIRYRRSPPVRRGRPQRRSGRTA